MFPLANYSGGNTLGCCRILVGLVSNHQTDSGIIRTAPLLATVGNYRDPVTLSHQDSKREQLETKTANVDI